MNDRNGRRSRRAFLHNTGAVAVSLYAAATTATGAGAATAAETLALHGGAKAVTYPEERHRDAFRWPRYGAEEESAVLAVLRTPGYSQNAALERDWKRSFRFPYARAFCHGTSAITAMFFALDLPPGSEIMVPSYTFFASIVPMRLFGLVPVFVDINPHTLNFDVEDARRRLTRNTRAVFPVHWLGLPCDMDDINAFAQQHGLIVFEDAAHAHGTSLKGKPTGS
jgi:dTDP-4-amino-4,6-dideoxygalactose transaminase